MSDDEEVQALVVDNGSGMCKVSARTTAHHHHTRVAFDFFYCARALFSSCGDYPN